MAQNVTNLLATFKDIFSGVSTCRYKKGDINKTQLATAVWDYELPVLTDGLEFTQGEPSVENVKILGQSVAWSTTSEAGDITMAITMPTVAKEVMAWLYTAATNENALTTKTETIDAHGTAEGYFKGTGYKLTQKKIEGTIMLINEAGTKALIIRHLSGYASFEYSDPASAPFAVKLTSTIASELADNTDTEDFDIALLDWTEA